MPFVEYGRDLPAGFRILSWNVQGLATRVCDIEFQNSIKFFQLLCLQETFLADSRKINLAGFSQGIFRSTGNGLAVFIREDLSDYIKVIEEVGHDSVIWVHAKLPNYNTSYCIACVYNFPSTSKNKNINFFENLSDDITVLTHKYSQSSFLLVGDFNSRTGCLTEYTEEPNEETNFLFCADNFSGANLYFPRSSCDSVVNAYGNKLLNFCRENGLYLMNGRYSDPKGEYTYLSTVGQSTIDYGITSPEVIVEEKASFFVLDSLCTLHRPISVILYKEDRHQPCSKKKDSVVPLITIPNKIVLRTEEEKQSFIERFERYFPLLEQGIVQFLDSNQIERGVNRLTDCIRLIGRPFIKKAKAYTGPVWFTTRHSVLKSKARRALRGYRKTRSSVVLQRYCNAKQNYNKEIKVAKKAHNQKLVENLNTAIKNNDSSSLWKYLKATKRRSNLAQDAISATEWVATFKKTLQYSTIVRPEWMVDVNLLPDVDQLDWAISTDEVRAILCKLKSGKSPGLSGISGSHLKLVKENISPFLSNFYNKIFDSGTFPSCWTHALLCPLFKNVGSPAKADNYRGIALLDQIGKCFTKILKQRLTQFVESNNLLRDNQGGFRTGRATTDNALILDTLVKRELEVKGGKLFVAFIDKKRAFDLCSRHGILFRLKELGVSKKMFRVIQSMFSDSKFSVKTSPLTATEGTKSTSGIFQGCSLSPLLFILFLDVIADHLNQVDSFSPDMAGMTIQYLLWADDLTLISKTKDGLQSLLDCLSSFCLHWGLVVNPKKTKIMIFRKGTRRCRNENLFFEGEKIQVVNKVRYLGFEFSSNGTWSHHKQIALQKASGAMTRLIAFFFKHKNLPAKIFRQLYLVLMDSILLYGSELWSVFPSGRSNVNDTNLVKQLYQSSNGLDKPMLRFLKLVLGVPRSAASSAVLLELGCNRSPSRFIPRAINYWLKLARLPENHIMSYCLRQQLSMMNNKFKPWLFYIKSIIDGFGFGYVWEQGARDSKVIAKLFQIRSNDIFSTMLFEEAQDLKSLKYYCERKNRITEIEEYTSKKYEERRIIALLRMNLKYALPFTVPDGTCKLCNELIESTNHIWSHFLYECTGLPPVEDSTELIPYPFCIQKVIRNPSSIVYQRIQWAFIRVNTNMLIQQL